VRIVQLANFYGPTSGGQRTAIDEVGQGYLESGLERVLVVPGPADADEETAAGRRISIRSPRLPGGSGYRVITDLPRVWALLEGLRPDRVEVSDKLTLWRAGAWARRHGVPSLLWSHERLDAILQPRVPGWFPLPDAANRWNRRLVRSFSTVVCSSAFGVDEMRRVGATNVVRVPLGVDLATFGPGERALRQGQGETVLVCTGRLSKEKRPDLAVDTLRALVRRGVPARLVLAGAGPEAAALQDQAAGLPVELAGHVAGRGDLSALLAAADVALAPCPVESFGLSVLEAMACGTPVVTTSSGAAHELLAPGAGQAAAPDGEAMATAVEQVLAQPEGTRRAAARRRAEAFPWAATVAGMLQAHRITPVTAGGRR
jgi:alpha-1,6-mannosyltransferase